MDLYQQGKHALITGGSKGIGLACASGLLAEGARVSLVSRGIDNLNAARKTPQEIANVVVFLCSSRASYITGAVLATDGAAKPVAL